MSQPLLALSRRRLLIAGGAAVAALSGRATALMADDAATGTVRLAAAPASAPLLGGGHPETAVWAYNDTIPGTTLRVRQAGRLRVLVENRLAQPTTVHWHGIRLANAMDGVPDLTQPPIRPGESLLYVFAPPDAGTFLYHSHANSAEQVGRGLSGALVVDEPTPPPVDRDLAWVIEDWRLLRDASIAAGFENRMDEAMSGRVGNTVTINGRLPDAVTVRAGERVRLRLINAAAARIMALRFAGHEPLIIALDGQPVEPHAPEGGRIVLGPAMRADLVIDMTGRSGQRYAVMDDFYPDLAYRLVDLAYTAEPPLRTQPAEAIVRLPPNPVPEPDLASAERYVIVLGGGMPGMMGGGAMTGNGGGMMGNGGGMMGMMSGGVWTMNGAAGNSDGMAPMLTLARGRSCVLELRNETAWWHPMHLHGHSFRVLARNGHPTRFREWRDTVLIPPRETAEIAFVAGDPGDWMVHCHVLDHQESGMMGVIRVA